MRQRWSDRERAALDRILGKAAVEQQLADHNPIYYLAERVFFDNVAGDERFLYAPLHRDLYAADLVSYMLDDGPDTSGYLLLSPRYTYKSTFTHGVFPLWVLLRWKLVLGEDARILMVHHKDEMAGRNLIRLKTKFMSHPWLRARFPEFCPETGREFGSSEQFTLPNVDPGRMAESSVAAGGIKSIETGGHFTVRVHDDIETEDHKSSRKIREDTKNRYEAARFQLEIDRPKEVNSGTIYHIHGIWHHLLKANTEGKAHYRVRQISAIADDNTLAHPGRLSAATLERLRQEEIARTGNDINWWNQMQNRPKSALLQAADLAWIKKCRSEDVPLSAWRVVLVDPAFKGTKNAGEGDYAALAVMAFERRGSLVLRYLLHLLHSNEMSTLDGLNAIFRLCRQFSTSSVVYEEFGGKTLISLLESEAIKRGAFIDLIELKGGGQSGKKARVPAFLATVQAGGFFLCTDGGDFEPFLEQYEDWGQLDHDDAIDVVSMCMDANVMQRIVPAFASGDEWGMQESMPQRRTRYCNA